jgi:hypothetical protein
VISASIFLKCVCPDYWRVHNFRREIIEEDNTLEDEGEEEMVMLKKTALISSIWRGAL